MKSEVLGVYGFLLKGESLRYETSVGRYLS